MKRKYTYIVLLLGSTLLSSCDKYLDIKPVGTVIPATTEDFRALMLSSYRSFPAHKSYLNLRTDELLLDEFSEDIPAIKDIYLWNDQNPDQTTTPYPYQTFYKSIFYANHLLAEIDTKAGQSAANEQLKAEALTMRAYAHFELLNMYAVTYNEATAGTDKGIPLSTKIDLEQPYGLATVAEVFKQIFSDLNAAGILFKENAPTANSLRYRFSKRAYYALQSRIHLYRKEWKEAKDFANEALKLNGDLENLNEPSSKLPNDFSSKEMIQALEEVGATAIRSTYVSPDFVALYHTGDLRKTRYFQQSGSRWRSVKAGNNQFNTSFRNGELYLNIAESSVQAGELQDARAALFVLAENRLTPVYYTQYRIAVEGLGKEDLLKEIYNERGRELALEGLRWFDLKRTTRPGITHTFGEKTYLLQQNDARYIIRYPKEAIQSNPYLLN